MKPVYKLFHEHYRKKALGNWSSTYFRTKNTISTFEVPRSKTFWKRKRHKPNKLSSNSLQWRKWNYQKNILVYISYLVITNIQYVNKVRSKIIFRYVSWLNSTEVLSNYIIIKFRNEIFIKKIMSGILRKSKYLIKRSQIKGIRLYITG